MSISKTTAGGGVRQTGRGDREPTHPGGIPREDVLPSLGTAVSAAAREQALDLLRAERKIAAEAAAIPTLRAA